MLSSPPPPGSLVRSLSFFAAGGGAYCVCCGLARLCYLACMLGGFCLWCTSMHALFVFVLGRSVGWSWCLPFLLSLPLSCVLCLWWANATFVSVYIVCFYLCYAFLLMLYVYLVFVVAVFPVSAFFCPPPSPLSVSCSPSFSLFLSLSLSVSFCLSICLLIREKPSVRTVNRRAHGIVG